MQCSELWRCTRLSFGGWGQRGPALLQALEHTTFDKGRINEARFPAAARDKGPSSSGVALMLQR